MLSNQNGEVVVNCDGEDCSEFLSADSFDDARDLLKDEEWKTVKSDLGWQHFCRNCK